MSKHRFVSAKEVLAKVIRGVNYRLPSTYADDILEWIPEGMGLLRVTNALVTESTAEQYCPGEVIVRNHCAELPCGFISILAVEDEFGKRLPEGSDVTDIRVQTSVRHRGAGTPNDARISTFEVDPYVHQTSDGLPADEPQSSFPFLGEDVSQVTSTPSSAHYYKIVGNYIQTSFESGFIRIHYLALPTGEDGYPLIPDDENYKLALEWHILKRLIGSGYEHPVFKYDYCDQQWERYAGRAIASVSYYNPEAAARLNRNLIRLIPPAEWYQNFSVNGEQPEILNK